jgi:hypothetical protein
MQGVIDGLKLSGMYRLRGGAKASEVLKNRSIWRPDDTGI